MRYAFWVAAAVVVGVSVMLIVIAAKPSRHRSSVDREAVTGRVASATGSCGVELWSIKTLTDSAAQSVSLVPRRTTIAALGRFSPPVENRFRDRSAPVETTTWRLVGTTLTGYKLERDSDVHLVLANPQGRTMIAEIPDPACSSGSRVVRALRAARAAFAHRHNLLDGCFDCLHERVTIRGVGFFDFLHGQHGVADNGIELHPVTGIRFW